MADPGPKPRITEDDVLDVFLERADPAEPLSIPEIADQLACSRGTVRNKLEALLERDVVATKKIGARGRVYWLPTEARKESRLDTIGLDPDDPFFADPPIEGTAEEPIDVDNLDDELGDAIAADGDDG